MKQVSLLTSPHLSLLTLLTLLTFPCLPYLPFLAYLPWLLQQEKNSTIFENRKGNLKENQNIQVSLVFWLVASLRAFTPSSLRAFPTTLSCVRPEQSHKKEKSVNYPTFINQREQTNDTIVESQYFSKSKGSFFVYSVFTEVQPLDSKISLQSLS